MTREVNKTIRFTCDMMRANVRMRDLDQTRQTTLKFQLSPICTVTKTLRSIGD